jgi:hypothetical protein
LVTSSTGTFGVADAMGSATLDHRRRDVQSGQDEGAGEM